jgi:undecaprenyl-phosphate 4-deoxy-4-formamido-L-arabinose transferase
MASLFMGKPPQLYVSSYYIASRYVIDEVLKYKNPYPYILGLILRTTKNIADVEVSHKERMEGESGYTVRKLLSLWLNGFTAFSIIPLRVSTALGVITSVLAFAYLIYTIIHKIVSPNVLIGWSSVISSVLLVGGVLMCMLGMLGEYIGRMYISLNNSPQFVIKESTRDERKDS